MIGRAISSKTSGGTGAGPGVNRYFFTCGIFDHSRGRWRLAMAAKKKAGGRACGSPDPNLSRLGRFPVLSTWDNGAKSHSQGDPGSRRFRAGVEMARRQLLKVI